MLGSLRFQEILLFFRNSPSRLNRNVGVSRSVFPIRKYPHSLLQRLGVFAAFLLISSNSQAGNYCPGASTFTWNGATANWIKVTNPTNWLPGASNYPGAAPNLGANVDIEAAAKVPTYPAAGLTIGCFEVGSGTVTMIPGGAQTLVVQGDFINQNSGSITTNANMTINMNGVAAQVFDNVDTINNLTISNPVSVDMPEGFTVSTAFTIAGTAKLITIDNYVTVPGFTIPVGATVEITSGGTLDVTGNLTVNGTLRIDGGGILQPDNAAGLTITVASGGQLLVQGASGNVAQINAPASQHYGIKISAGGSLTANYFEIANCNTTTPGIDIFGTISTLSNGEFHNIAGAAAGEAITLESGATSPNWSDVGFFNEAGTAGTFSVNATNYDGTGAAVVVSQWSGIGTTKDAGSKVSFTTQAPIAIELTDASAAKPASPIAVSTQQNFGAFGFALNGVAAATTVTSVTVTLNGNNSANDVSNVTLFANCAGNKTGSSWSGSFVGSPPQAVVALSVPASTIVLANQTQSCLQVYLTTSANAVNLDTIGAQITATGDVTDSKGYGFPVSSGPPLSLGLATINGVAGDNWNGKKTAPTGLWNTRQNWSTSAVPTAAVPCNIGAGHSYPQFVAAFLAPTCLGTTFESGGQIDFNNQAVNFTVDGDLQVASGYPLLNAASSTLTFGGAAVQSIEFNGGTWGGNVVISNAAGVTLNSDMTITGNLTISSGTLTVASGSTLTVGGTTLNVGGGGVAAGLTLQPGATLQFSSALNPVMTVGNNGTLTLVGNSSTNVTVTSTVHPYTVVVNGSPSTISAQYYTFSNLGTNGVTIGATATINAANNLLNGSFLSPVNNGSTLLTVKASLGSATLNGMTFDANGSAASPIVAMSAAGNANTAAVTLNSYSGSYTGTAPELVSSGTYVLSWGTSTDSLELTNPAGLTTPAALSRSATVTMGDWGFQEAFPGAATNLTSIKVTMTGTDGAGDVSSAAIYQDTACNGTVGAQLGSSGTLSGSPGAITFSGFSYAVTTVKTCVLLQFTISPSALAGTIGAEIAANGDVVNSQGFLFKAGSAPAVTLGAAGTVSGAVTTWTAGAGNALWTTASNWNAGVPTAPTDCVIATTAHNPAITAAMAAVCKSVTINSGATLTLTAGSLQINNNFTNNGTFTAAAGQAVQFADGGAASTQTVSGTGTTTFDTLTFSKAAGGAVDLSSLTVTVNTAITFSGTSTLDVQGGSTLVLPAGVTIAAATLQLEQNSIVQIGNGKTLTVSGGKFTINGASSIYPAQTLANSGEVTVQGGAGSWSFNATSGTVSLTGWVFDRIATTGAVIGNGAASVTLAALNSGQFAHLATITSKSLVINTTGALPATASNIGWEWDSNSPGLNSANGQSASPPAGTGYSLASSTGCGSQTIAFQNWFGDWEAGINGPNPTSVIQPGATCAFTFAQAQSPVSLISFNATPYNGAVVLGWVTGLETANQGFNVYRSLTPAGGFVQINSSLIRNVLDQGTVHGIYQFYDNGIGNGVTYYYEIEDIATNGTATLHGPVSAAPAASLATAPAPDPSSIQGSNSDNPLPAPATPQPFAPGTQQLSPGVTLVAQTDNSMRITINVPAFTTSPAQVSPYVNVAIPGYSSTTTPGLPALPQRVVMLEIPGASSVTDTIVNQSNTTQAGIRVAPALQWLPQSGVLTPTWALDSTFYAIDQSLPSTPISLGQIVQSQGHTYLPLIIEPVSFDPVQPSIVFTSQITVDIALNGGTPWTPANPTPPAGPWGMEDALKISISQEGVYQLAYSDFVNGGVDEAFSGKDLTHFKLYSQGSEIPLDVTSVNGGSFGTGDSIRFFAPYTNTGESTFNTLMLIADTPSSPAGLRMQAISGAPAGAPVNPADGFINSVHVEQNFFEWLNGPYMEGGDQIFWAQIKASPTDHSQDSAIADFQLPDLVQTGTVSINAMIGGSFGYYTTEAAHHLRIWVNSDPRSSGDAYFTGTAGYIALFRVPATLFVPGDNTIRFQSVGDLNGDDYDVMGLNYFNVDYTHDWVADNDVANMSFGHPGDSIDVSNFGGNDILVYDVSDYTVTATVSGAVINGAGPYDVNFASVSGDSSHGRHFWIGRASALPVPMSIELNEGSSLSSNSNGADVIYVGPAELLDSVRPLAALRQQQGFRTQLVDIEDVYSEFGQGLRSAADLKSFIQFASTQWTAPALRYVVLVGGGTDDPSNSLGLGADGTVPTYMMVGSAMDFASDNWFVSFNASDDLPGLAIGRIPGRTPALISTYVAKVLAYEGGAGRPQASASGNLTLIADDDQVGGEGFAPTAQTLSTQITSLNGSINTTLLLRPNMTDPTLKQSIVDAFNSGSTIIHYLGHGAENMWADSTVFTNSDAAALQNTVYPVVVAMDCLNAAYFYADPNYATLSHTLLFNPSGGAIAFWGSPSLTSSDQQIPYQTALYQILATTPGGIRLGDAIRLAKVQAGWIPARAEMVRSFTLLGDPMLNVILPGTPAPQPPSPPQSAGNSDNSSGGGGFFSCLSLAAMGKGGGPGDGPSGPSSGAFAEAALLLAMMFASRRLTAIRSR